MIYPKNIEQKLGFDELRLLLKAYCENPLSQAIVDNIAFSDDFDEILKKLLLTDEMKTLISSEPTFHLSDYFDVIGELKRIKTKGSFIEIRSLQELKISLETATFCLSFFENDDIKNNFKELTELSSNIFLDFQILQFIVSVINNKGEILDSASSHLKKIRLSLNKKKRSVEDRIVKALLAAKKNNLVDEETQYSVLNDRPVIPVPANNKRKIKGLIHGQSATGKTIYIEPIEVLEINNEIKELENEEKREIVKILIKLTDNIRPHIQDIIESIFFLVHLDFLQAKARLANTMKASMPHLRKKIQINWQNAIHPLLYLHYRKSGKNVVPMNLFLNENERIVIISGPNAGGKSICLKTVGLLQYMLQCGLLVTVFKNSHFSIFSEIFVDIGDDQSLEDNLSTYSSHLKNMKFFLEKSSSQSLILIDEFGAGTEPYIGGAVAETILEELNKKKVFAVITTHYANLKLMSKKNMGIVNAAMLFDTKKMLPLYQLRQGQPGSSFTLEIVKLNGFTESLIKKTSKKLDGKQLDFELQLNEIELLKRTLQKKEYIINIKDDVLAELIEKHKTLLENLKKQKNDMIAKAEAKAENILNEANQLIEKTIKDIKESKAEKITIKKLRNTISEKKEKLTKKREIETKKNITEAKKIYKPFNKGETVKIIGQTKVGFIENIKAEKATVVFDNIKIRIPLHQLEHTEDIKSRRRKSNYSEIITNLNKNAANFNTTLDVIGNNAEEALKKTNQFIDDAILFGVKELKIIHGKGYGILRDLIRKHLESRDEIKNYTDEHINKGGHGVTIVLFK